MAEIHHEMKIGASPTQVYDALATQDGLKGWYTPSVEHDPGARAWRFKFAGRPSFSWEITGSTAGERVDWTCLEGPNDAPGTKVAFKVSKVGDGRAMVEVVHSEWPGDQGNFRKCNTYWGVLLHHLKEYAETGVPAPAFD